MHGTGRAWLWAALIVAVWGASVELDQPWRVLPGSAPPGEFSAARAEAALARLLGPQRPHPLSSEQNAQLRTRILGEFAALGVPTQTYRAFTCNTWRGFGYIPCATVTDILAEVLPGSGKAITMMAHYDSVAAGPGASDDQAGVAAVLEAARALRAERGTRGAGSAVGRHPVLALITDGEEAGLLGAHAFLENAALRARVGAVVNVEARGTSGPSLLFQTSPGDARLIDLYGAHVRARDTSSLYAVVYRYLPNDTDLTLFIRAGIPAFNFAFARNVRYYHSPLDRRDNLSAASLQMQGDSLLGVVRGLERTPYAALAGGDAIYLTVFNRLLLHLPAGWALPLSIAAFLALALASVLARDEAAAARQGQAPAALLMPPALLVGALALGFLLTLIARLLSGMPDPGYAHPSALRAALALALWAVTLAVSRALGVRAAAAGAWLWLGALGVVIAAVLPGFSPYFLCPCLPAAVLLLATARMPGSWSGRWGQLALLLAALIALIVWIGLAASLDALLGLRPYALLVLTAAFGITTLVPLLAARPMAPAAARASILGTTAGALVAAVVAGLLPAYSVRSPERIDLIYYQTPGAGRWLVDSSWRLRRPEPVPSSLLSAGHLHRSPVRLPGLSFDAAYVSGSFPPRLPLPQARLTIAAPAAAQTTIEDSSAESLRAVTLQLRGSADTDAMIVEVPQAARLQSIDVGGEHLVVPHGWRGDTRLACVSRDCRNEVVTLTLAGSVGALPFVEERYGLPPFGAPLAAARPATAMPTQSGDEVMLANVARLP